MDESDEFERDCSCGHRYDQHSDNLISSECTVMDCYCWEYDPEDAAGS